MCIGVFLKLKAIGINAVGTIMNNRRGLTNMIKFSDQEANILARGSLRMAKHQLSGTNDYLLALGWLDTKPVYMIATGIASRAEHVVRRLKNGTQTVLSACRPITLYHKYMGGVDTHDYMRMGSYSLQKSYHMNYWPKTMFLALMDLVLVNLFILWKLIHNGTIKMKQREEFYNDLAEEMFFYRGFEPYVTRNTSRPSSRAPSPAPATPKPNSIDFSTEYLGHNPVQYLPKPKKKATRSTKLKQIAEDYKYGKGGRGYTYRHCFVCQRLSVKRYDTNEYCSTCRVPVCPRKVIRISKEGKNYICWNELHSNKKIIDALDKKVGVPV
jgi:hypothetical protein